MNHEAVIKIFDGHPVLAAAGHISLAEAASISGLGESLLLRKAAEGTVRLFFRCGNVPGFVLPRSSLAVDDAEVGTRVVPDADHMPEDASAHIAIGSVLAVHLDDVRAVAGALLAGIAAEVVLFAAEQPGFVFVPNETVQLKRNAVEVSTTDVDIVRRSMAGVIAPEQLEVARSAWRATLKNVSASSGMGKHSGKLLSEALAEYDKLSIRQRLSTESEILRERGGCALLIDLMGDLRLSQIDADLLRLFRDTRLCTVPANEGRMRSQHGTKSIAESIELAPRISWPLMSLRECNKRMG
jgi:hypothetical protein